MSSCSGSDKSISVYWEDGAAMAGTDITPALLEPNGEGNIWKTVSVINDTDQDIKVVYKTTEGENGEFIVPKSIRGFTRMLSRLKFTNSTFTVFSLGSADAAGNISFNFSS